MRVSAHSGTVPRQHAQQHESALGSLHCHIVSL
jgi:hypothetical protein